ncbi:hypothetical protein QF031_000953 [Pseudarthrobacter defluvii]|uniref:hypothetical protein n=1 Tax=Pseudarthrobacter defluvii TaxID=410837 RepID=UPI002784EB0E|nr:hypothetical protein [Pseudarthrobacter defluvii]MDQ0768204.1 hypothetical protein [Pseudarthrobacter defluvii]
MKSILETIRGHATFIFWTLFTLVALVVGYWLIRDFKLDANTIAAVSGAIAAMAGALAAIASLGAARESRRTAKDATRALALASKPIPVISVLVNPSPLNLERMRVVIKIENLSPHAIRGGTLHWVLRDGTTGSQPVEEIQGRSIDRGTQHRYDGIAYFLAAAIIDDWLAGVDRVTLDYYGEVRDVVWRSTMTLRWEVIPDEWTVRDGIRVPSVKRSEFDRTDVEIRASTADRPPA